MVANPLTHTWAFGSHHHPGCVSKAGKSALRRVASYTSTGRQSPPKLWCSRGASSKPNHRHPEVAAQHSCLKVSAASHPSAADSLQARRQSWARRFGTAAQGNERRWHWPHPPVVRTPAGSCRAAARPSPTQASLRYCSCGGHRLDQRVLPVCPWVFRPQLRCFHKAIFQILRLCHPHRPHAFPGRPKPLYVAFCQSSSPRHAGPPLAGQSSSRKFPERHRPQL